MGPEQLAELTAWIDTIRDPARDLPDEVTCRRMLADVRFVPGFRCPHCNSDRGVRAGNEHPHWRCRDCRYRTSVTAGTIMHGTRIELKLWMAAWWYQTHRPRGMAALEFQKIFDMPSYGTAWRLNHDVRSCFAGSQRAGLRADLAPSQACIQILGRHRPEEPHLEAHCAIDLSERNLLVATGPSQPVAAAAVDDPATRDLPGKERTTAHKLLESFRSAIIGTYNGVSPKYLPRYAHEFFGRFGGALADVDVLQRLVAPFPIPDNELWDDQPPFEPDDDDTFIAPAPS